jgi:hypothetical protein
MASKMRVQLASVHWGQCSCFTDTVLPIILKQRDLRLFSVVEESGLLRRDGVDEFVIPDVSKRHRAFFLDSLIRKDKSIALLQNVWNHQPNDKASHPKRPTSSMQRNWIIG